LNSKLLLQTYAGRGKHTRRVFVCFQEIHGQQGDPTQSTLPLRAMNVLGGSISTPLKSLIKRCCCFTTGGVNAKDTENQQSIMIPFGKEQWLILTPVWASLYPTCKETSHRVMRKGRRRCPVFNFHWLLAASLAHRYASGATTAKIVFFCVWIVFVCSRTTSPSRLFYKWRGGSSAGGQ